MVAHGWCLASPVARFRPGSRIETPLCRLAHRARGVVRLAALRARLFVRRLRGGDAAAGGFDAPCLLVAFPGASLARRRQHRSERFLWLGLCLRLRLFRCGLYWISAALFVDIASFWWLVPIAAAGLPAALALYTGMALSYHKYCKQIPAIAGHRAGFRICDRLDRRRMDPRPRVYRAPLEPDRLRPGPAGFRVRSRSCRV